MRAFAGLLLAAGGVARAADAPAPPPPPGARPPPPGAPAPDPRVDADALFKDLTSDSFEVREAARRRLAGVAARIRPALEARRDDPDPEVRRTALALLASIGASTEVAAPTGTLGTEGLVTLTAEGPLASVLGRFDDVAGGRVRLAPAVVATPVRVELEAKPWFEALATILDAARLDVGEGFDDAGQAQSVAKDPGAGVPVAYSGPFRLEVESVSTTRILRSGGASRHLLALRLLWAPSVQVVSWAAPQVVVATDGAGRRYVGSDPGHVFFGVGGARRIATISVGIAPNAEADADAARLDRLELELRIRLRRTRGLATIPLGDEPAFPLRRSVEFAAGTGVGEAEAVLESFGPDAARPGWWAGVVSARLPRGVEPSSVSAALDASDGLLRPLVEQSSRITGADGSVQLSVRAWNLPPEVRPRAIRVTAYAREEEVAVRFTLRGVPLR